MRRLSSSSFRIGCNSVASSPSQSVSAGMRKTAFATTGPIWARGPSSTEREGFGAFASKVPSEVDLGGVTPGVRNSMGGRKTIPDDAGISGSNQQQSVDGQTTVDVKEALKTANTTFTSKVSNLNERYDNLFASRDEQEKKKLHQRNIERKKMLTFREVDSSLDRVELGRDLFLFKNLIYGIDYVVDFLLERELIYNIQAPMTELRTTPKMFRGLPYALPRGKPFPDVSASVMSTILPPLAGTKAASAAAAMGDITEKKSNGEEDATAAPTKEVQKKPASFDSGADVKVQLNKSFFKRPHVVIISPLLSAQNFDTTPQWTALFEKYLATQKKVNAQQVTQLITLKTIDSTADFFLRKYLVKRYAAALSGQRRTTSFVGHKLIRCFTQDFDLRNYATTYCFLVDHKGHVRWMSQGPIQDIEESEHFIKATKRLETEFYRAGGKPLKDQG